MVYILIGCLSFVLLLLFDVMSMKNKIVEKYIFAFLGISLLICCSLMIILLPSNMVVNDVIRSICLPLTILFSGLLVYSVFIEVGGNTYQKIAEPSLVTNGTYSLVRHPGVLWFFLAYTFGAILLANRTLLLAAFVWGLVNLIYTLIQEYIVLRRIFSSYKEYSMKTPMFFPNFTSIKSFMTTENWRK